MNFSNGNDWDEEIVYNCKKCGVGNLCDVCHRHCMPRGACTECPRPTKKAKKRGARRE